MQTRQCQWCGDSFETEHRSKVYCSAACRNAFGSFITTIGKRIAPVAMAWRVKRGTKGVGADAMKEMCKLLDQANEEYSKREAKVKRPPNIAEHFVAVRRPGTGVRVAAER